MPEVRKLAVLIDADNTSPKVADALFEEVAKIGEASLRRIYGDFSKGQQAGWERVLARHAILPTQQFAYTTGKNSTDITLVIDAMDLLHSGRFDGFCLVSSDSDFTRLASRIREQGLDVYGIGEKKTPEAFRNACKRFIYVENLGAEEAPAPTAETGTEAHPSAPATALPSAPAPAASGKLAPANAIPLVVAAMKRIGLEEDWYSLGQIGQFITQANPDFDTRTYGCAKLSDLLRRTGRFEVKQGQGNHLMVRDKA